MWKNPFKKQTPEIPAETLNRVDKLVRNFHQFICLAQPPLYQLSGEWMDWHDDPYHWDDWFQANWELMVERILATEGQFLIPYSCGYGRYTNDGRYLQKNAPATHEITCTYKGKTHRFHAFITRKSKKTQTSTPYEIASVWDSQKKGKLLDLPLEGVVFEMKALKKPILPSLIKE